HLGEHAEERAQADDPDEEAELAGADARGTRVADGEAVDERLRGQDVEPLAPGAGRRGALAEQGGRRDLDERAGRAGRHAGLIGVAGAVIALVGDPARLGLAALAGAERELAGLVE